MDLKAAFTNPGFMLQETSSGISMKPTRHTSGDSAKSKAERRPSTIAAPGGVVIDIDTAVVAPPGGRKISVRSGHRVRVDAIFSSNSDIGSCSVGTTSVSSDSSCSNSDTASHCSTSSC